ncbi:hypothetical protein DM860_011154 [Cuscuta australis]|uniref:Reverse transcriptase n=1 Tax=Cuscuta australis TaxID=267555 RepID=A0A328DAM7_9ASTE|nr:hypothetical protein DM860_011154 [Cuscuta australis]
MKALFWNVCGIKYSLNRLILLKKCYNFIFLAIFEPIVEEKKLDFYKLKLGFNHGFSSQFYKCWIFWDSDKLSLSQVQEGEQVTTCIFNFVETKAPIFFSSVYGKHNRIDRLNLWESLIDHNPEAKPWMVGGDFNTITSYTEHQGNSSPCSRSMEDFRDFILSCNLLEPTIKGSFFTWMGYRSKDDLIIFLKGNLRNILRFRHLLDSYLKASGQEVNKKKSRIFCKKGSRGLYTRKLEDTLGFKVGNPPFKYLGSTITRGKLKKTHCDHILHHFDAYINNWYSKELNPMSRLILIKHVLSAIPMHTLAVQDLPKSIIRTIHGKLANFFWGSKQGRNHYHWAKWDTLTRPTGEGGLGIRNLEDIQKASALKLWWKSLTGDSLWARFMKNKYAGEGTSEAKIYDSASWKRICRISPIGLQFTTITNQNVSWVNGNFSFKEAYWAVRERDVSTQINTLT